MTGSQQPGIAAPGSSTAAQTRTQLQNRLKQLTDRRQKDLAELETLPQEIAEAQSRVATAQSEAQSAVSQGIQQDSAAHYDYLMGQHDRRNEEAQLNQQIQQKKKQVDELNRTYQWQSSGNYFSPANVVTSDQVSSAQQELQNLQDRALTLQSEDSQASAHFQATQNWEALQRSRVEQQTQETLSAANQQLQQLSARYQKLQQDVEESRVAMGNLEDELRVPRPGTGTSTSTGTGTG